MSGAVIRIAVIAVVGIFCVQASSQPTSDVDQMPAGEFLRKAIDNELKAQSEDHSHWMYRVKSGSPGKEEEKIVVQTGQGEIDRLHDVNGQPVTPIRTSRRSGASSRWSIVHVNNRSFNEPKPRILAERSSC